MQKKKGQVTRERKVRDKKKGKIGDVLGKFSRNPGSILMAQFAHHNHSFIGHFNGSCLVTQADLVIGATSPFATNSFL